jgi:hypothetical protein
VVLGWLNNYFIIKYLLIFSILIYIYCKILRQKIDEPPTPYEYGSDSELSNDELEGGFENSDASNMKRDSANINKISNSLNGGSIKDNWENINAKLYIHQQQQLTKDEIKNSNLIDEESNNNNINNNNNDTENIFNFSKPDPPILDLGSKLIIENTDNRANDDESDKINFKNKRAAHYNEFKMIQAMKAKMALGEDDEEDDIDES